MVTLSDVSGPFTKFADRLVDRLLPVEEQSTVLRGTRERFWFAFGGGLFVTLIVFFGRSQRLAPTESPATLVGIDPLMNTFQSYIRSMQNPFDIVSGFLFLFLILAGLFVYSYTIAISLPKRGPLSLLIAGSTLPILMLSLGKIALS